MWHRSAWVGLGYHNCGTHPLLRLRFRLLLASAYDDGLPKRKGRPSSIVIELNTSFHYDLLYGTITKNYDVKSLLQLIKFFAIRRVNAYVVL